MLFAGLLCLICVSMSVTVGVVASAETEETEETGETTPTSNTTPAAMTTASTPGGDCVGAWSEFGDCSQECSYNESKGTKTRTYAITTEAGDGGAACPHTAGEEESQECGMTACTPMDCVGDWDAWKVQGTNQTRDWTITQEPKYGGAECDVAESARTESKACTDATACPPVNCVGSWVNVGTCSATCGPDGKQSKRYDVSTPASGVGGVACPHEGGATKQESCNTDVVCPVNCVGSYGNWSSCSQTCDGGTRRRTYSVTTPAAGTGTACPFDDGHVEDGVCNENPCNVDCEGSWTHYPNVNDEIKAGFGGHKTMKYVVTKPKSGTGKDCMHAFTREAPKVGATDVTRNWAGHIQNTNDRWTSEVVIDGQIAEVFTYQNQASEQESRLKTPDYIKYCMRKPGTVSKNVKTGRDGVYTSAYGQDDDIKSHTCDDDD